MCKYTLTDLLRAKRVETHAGGIYHLTTVLPYGDDLVYFSSGERQWFCDLEGHATTLPYDAQKSWSAMDALKIFLCGQDEEEPENKSVHWHIGNAEELIKYLNTVASINNTIGSIDTDTFPSSMDAKVLCLDTIKAAITECNRVYGLDINNK